MNKIVNVNLGGYPFNIDEDAYEHLKNYLNTIHRHFTSSEGYDEITTDIEIRLAEIFQEQLGSRSIVSRADVQAAISVMGTPEEFGAEPIEENTSYERPTMKTGKRLFRNGEDKVVGGVCSGLAAYLGIQDPLWLRILLVILVLSSVGFLIPAYLIAWAIVPEAKTSSDRLAMKGEPINVSNIGKMVEDEMKDLSKRISDIGDNISDEFKHQKKRIDGSGGSIHDALFEIRNALAQVIAMLGKVIHVILRTISRLWKPLLMIVSLIVAIVFIAVWIASAVGIFVGLPFVDYITPDRPWVSYVSITNAFVVIAIPMLSILLLLMRGWTRYRLNSYWRAGLGAFWMLNVISFFSVGSVIARDFNAGANVDKSSFPITNTDTLYLSMEDIGDYNQSFIRLFDEDIIFDEDQLVLDMVDIGLIQSSDEDFHLVEDVYARGRTRLEASQLASSIDITAKVVGNKIVFPSHIEIPKGTKFRGQHVNYRIGIPKGKYVKFDREVGNHIEHFSRSDKERSHWYHRPGVWRMEADGLVNMTNREQEGAEKHYYYGIEKYQIEGEMEVDFYYSNRHKIEVNAKGKHRDQVEFKKLDDQVFITSNIENPERPIRLSIGLSNLQAVQAYGTDDVKIEGFDQKAMDIVFNSEYELKLLSNIEHLKIRQKGSGKIELV
ncbi:MAG: PspC domain-containing protein, partial [Bacteroidota bacterium]